MKESIVKSFLKLIAFVGFIVGFYMAIASKNIGSTLYFAVLSGLFLHILARTSRQEKKECEQDR